MKIRTGFVSNSSTCSFIICIGKIIDKDAFDRVMTDPENEIMASSVVAVTGKEILENMREYLAEPDWCYVNINRDKKFYSEHKNDMFAICSKCYGDYHFYDDGYDDDDEEPQRPEDIIAIDVRPNIDFFGKLFDAGAIDKFEYDYDWGYNG